MAQYTGQVGAVNLTVAEMTTQDPGHPNTFNPKWRQFLNNDAELADRIAKITPVKITDGTITYTGPNITKIVEKNGAAVTKTTDFTYNATTGFLETEKVTVPGTPAETTTYNYDANGTMTGITVA